MSPSQRPSPVQDLENRLNARWQHISKARALAIQTRAGLAEALRGADSEDSSIVVSGSLARNEFTPGSDIDWSLLIDGQADPDVIDILPRIEDVINAAAPKPPGRERTFGTMAFSHELIHQIGGEDDTNRNTTRRILLLLESSPIAVPTRTSAWSRASFNATSARMADFGGLPSIASPDFFRTISHDTGGPWP